MLTLSDGKASSSGRKIVGFAGFTQILETSFFLTSFIITILAVHVLVSWIFTLKFLTEMTSVKYENKIAIWEAEKLTSGLESPL